MEQLRIISKFLSALAASAATALVLSSFSYAQEFVWDMPNEYGENTVIGEADKIFAERLERNSGGRIKITNHFGGSLGYRSKDHWSAVKDRTVPIASTYTGDFSDFDPIFLFNNLPFVATNPAQSKALIDSTRPWYDEAFAKGGQMLLLAMPGPPVGIWSQKAIGGSDDLKGLKIRTYDANGTIAFNNLGAKAIRLSWADVIPALSTNAIEAVLTSAEGVHVEEFSEYLSHFHHVNFIMGINMVHLNLNAFESLPSDLQKILADTAKEVEEELWTRIDERISLNSRLLKDKDVTVISEISETLISELEASGQQAIDAWKDAMGTEKAAEILSAYESALEERK